MSVGFIMLVHHELDRAAQVARHLASAGCPVVIHIDASVDETKDQRLKSIMRGYPRVRFSERFTCEWGTWSIVSATRAAAKMMLREFSDVGHVFLTSGSCLPLRPIPELVSYLKRYSDTDFIESVTTSEVTWTLGGLEHERFSLYFPFAWKKRRKLFDAFIKLQRRLGIRRRPPPDLVPHLGSQWWCLTRDTLARILGDPELRTYDRYFRSLWIPDESYFQTLVRKHSDDIESRSLTLSKFDYQGRPHVFYDDHLELLRRSDCFFARKIWSQADRLYQNFLTKRPIEGRPTEPNPAKIDRLFSKAVDRRIHGRHGLIMQSRFVRNEDEAVQTAWPYSVFQGYGQVINGFDQWLTRATGTKAHGRLMHPRQVEFAGRVANFKGGLSDSVALRDYDEAGFIRNLIWNTRGERQYFQYAPEDGLDAWLFMARDPNAQISLISGAWAIPLSHSREPFEQIRRLASQFQRREQAQIDALTAPWAQARVRIHSLADYLVSPVEPLQEIIDEAAPPGGGYLGETPVIADLTGFGKFLQRLRNAGMKPYLAGHFSTDTNAEVITANRKPQAVRAAE